MYGTTNWKVRKFNGAVQSPILLPKGIPRRVEKEWIKLD